MWDPYEVNMAELARRIAVNLFGAQGLALEGADNTLPHLDDLGRPELAFTSIALGFRLFGLHEWAGRLPLAMWALLGVAATYASVRALFDRRAALYSSIALITMPAYFVQARTMMGDIVAMSALAMAFGGLTVAVFGEAEERSAKRLALWLAMAGVGLLSGYESRGALIGIAVPLLSVGLGWGVARASGESPRRADVGDWVGGAALIAGLVTAVFGVSALEAAPASMSMWVGAMIKIPAKYPSFEALFGTLAATLAPWSAFIPFAMGRLAVVGHDADKPNEVRRHDVRAAIVIGAAVAFLVQGWLARYTEPIAFAAPVIFAITCGVALRDYERGAHPSIAVGVGTAVLLGLLHHDFHAVPEKAMQVFAVTGAAIPETFKSHALTVWTIALVGSAAVALLTWSERDPKRKPFDRNVYALVLKSIRGAWGGIFAAVQTAAVVGAAVAALLAYLSGVFTISWLPATSLQAKPFLLNTWWVLWLAPYAIPLLVLAALDVALWFFRRVPSISRAAAMLIATALAGAMVSVAYYSALASQLSPKDVFGTYVSAAKKGEPLGLLGVGGRTAAYYAGGDLRSFATAHEAIDWLLGDSAGGRRFMVIKAEELGRLNKLYRSRRMPMTNISVIDARAATTLLVASSPVAGFASANRLDDKVLTAVPKMQHSSSANFDDKLHVLGYSVVDSSGKAVESVLRGRKYHLQTVMRVLQPFTSEWQIFLHVDGQNRRVNGDHKPLQGAYPMMLWAPGDIVVDDYEFSVESGFPPGVYTMYFGFFAGEARIPVKSGSSDNQNRLIIGELDVK